MTSQNDYSNASSNKRLHLIVNATEKCNFRCVYCYEDFALGRMKPVVAGAIVKLVRRRVAAGLQQLELAFFGGEPLAAWSIVRDLAENLSAICAAGGVSFISHVTTNGALLDSERLAFLVAHGVNEFQITLDGPEVIHDQRRVLRSGKGTFQAVMAAFEAIRQSGLPTRTIIRQHFAPDTLDALVVSGHVTALARRFLTGDTRFFLYFYPLGHWGGPNDGSFPVFSDPGERRAAIDRLVAAALAGGCDRRQLITEPPDICYAAAANSFVIRPDGRVAKCTIAFEDDRNCVGVIEPNGDLVIDRSRFLPWVEGLVDGEADKLACPRRHVVVASGAG